MEIRQHYPSGVEKHAVVLTVQDSDSIMLNVCCAAFPQRSYYSATWREPGEQMALRYSQEFCFRIICWYCITAGVRDIYYTHSLPCEATETAKPRALKRFVAGWVRILQSCLTLSFIQQWKLLQNSFLHPTASWIQFNPVSLRPTLPSTFEPLYSNKASFEFYQRIF